MSTQSNAAERQQADRGGSNVGAIVIVGGGVASARAAEALREAGHAGPVTIMTVEEDLPYDRPPLSKGYLLGEDERDTVFLHDRAWYDDNDITVRTGTWVTGADLAQRELSVDGSDEPVPYDRLLLATGSWPRRLEVPGADGEHVHYLRDLPEADTLKTLVAGKQRLVIVGAGWIGLEIAAAARHHDTPVTVLETADVPLARVLGTQLGERLAALHREHGVDLRTGTGVAEIVRDDDGAVVGIKTTDGDQLDAAAVIVGIGADPQIDWIGEAGITLCTPEQGGGVEVDKSFHTSDPHVWSAGDIANVEHPLSGERFRVEHWAMAYDSGPVAARALLGEDVEIDFWPFFYTDQYDWSMEYLGHVAPGTDTELIIRGDVEAPKFQAFWVGASGDRNGVVLAGLHVNEWDDGIDAIKALLGKRVDQSKLADASVELSDTPVD